MANYNVYIIDPFDEVAKSGGPGGLVSVATKLNGWFDPIVALSNTLSKTLKFDRASVMFPQYIVSPQPHELIVYICPFGTSVVQKKPGVTKANWPDPVTSQHQGITEIGAVTGSEVWMKFSGADAIASLIFHESMHNKLQLGNAMHGKLSPCQLSCASINWPNSGPSKPEVDAMAKALTNPVRQWTDGQKILWDAKARSDQGDPFWNSDINA